MNILKRMRLTPLRKNYFKRNMSWSDTFIERNKKESWSISKKKRNPNVNKKKQYLSIKKHEEYQYLNLVRAIMNDGVEQTTRNGNTKSIIGASMKFSLNNSKIPILTTKKLAWRSCLKELLWFISGDTNNETLVNQNVKIWNDNASREFLDSRGLQHHKEGDLGPIYGYQWRHYNLEYVPLHVMPYIDRFEMNKDKGIDQLDYIIKSLQNKDERNSRRLIMTAWNPEQIDSMALPPCHVMSQFSVLNNKLYCTMYQRSGDVGLGIPFNIASYSFLTILLAKHCGLEPGEFIHFIGNAHIYKEHEAILKTQLNNQPYEFPSCEIKEVKSNINDYEFSDFKINNYKYHKAIKMDMIP